MFPFFLNKSKNYHFLSFSNLILYSIFHLRIHNFTGVTVSAYQKHLIGFRVSAHRESKGFSPLNLIIFNNRSIVLFHSNVKMLKR